jgi:anaerobic magnesium-protoporphyrin IX monomethyl ester cyclase
MKILLINPPLMNLVQAETPKFVTQDRGFSPPLGIIWIATCINKFTEHQAFVLDTQVEELGLDAIKEKIKEINPDIVGMAAITFTLLDSLKMAELVKGVNSNIKVVLGGPHATLYPNETIQQGHVDYIIAGEGEKAFPDLVECLGKGEQPASVKGVYFKDKEGNIVGEGKAEVIDDLNELPLPDRTLVPYKKYFSLLSKHRPLTTMMTSRGCPYRCTFCDRPQMGGKSYRQRSAKLVVDEMEQCKNMGINEILFYDDTWTMDRKRAVEICNLIKERNLDIAWDIRTRVDRVDPELVALMKSVGLERINFGVEAGTREGLAIVKKDVSLEKIEKAFKMCKNEGLDTLGYFIVGMPGETKEMMYETIKFAKRMKPSFAHFTVFTPFPQTEVWRDLIAKGDLRCVDAWKGYAEKPDVAFDPPTCNDLSKAELMQVLDHAYKYFYLRPGYVVKELSKVRSFGEFWRKAKAGIRVLTASA